MTPMCGDESRITNDRERQIVKQSRLLALITKLTQFSLSQAKGA